MPDSQFPALTTTLQLYARSLPEVAVVKVGFELEPDYGPETTLTMQRPAEPGWTIKATLQCFGGLKTEEAVDPEGGDYLEGAEPIEVAAYSWEGVGPSFDEAMAQLIETVRVELEQKMVQYQEGLALAQGALAALCPDPS